MNADGPDADECYVGSDRELSRHPSVSANVQSMHAGILSLVTAEMPDLYEIPFRAIEDRLNPSSIAVTRGRMPPHLRLLGSRHLIHL